MPDANNSFTDSSIGDWFQNISGLIGRVTPVFANAINPEDAWRYGYNPYSPSPYAQQQSSNILIVGVLAIGALLLLRSGK